MRKSLGQTRKSIGQSPLNPNFVRRDSDETSGVSEVILKQARKSGQLNLSSRSLKSVPSAVWKINVEPPTGADQSASFEVADDERWWDQVDLVKLILAGNDLQELSEDIVNLPALQVLDAHDNNLMALPNAIGSLENLNVLSLNHNSLSVLQPSVSFLTNLQHLKLDHNSLKQLPDTLGQLIHLQELDVSHNKLSELPSSIGGIISLKTFSAAYNCLTSVPESIGTLKEVKFISLTNNKLSNLPTFSGADNLEIIELQYNLLTEIPQILPGLLIKQLHLGFNKISMLDLERLLPLTSLVILDIRDNKIEVVPGDLTRLTTLERLDLTNNNIHLLPFEVGNMPNIKSLMVDGNNLRGLRRGTIEKGTSEILKFLSSRIPSDTPLEEPAHHSTKFTPTKQQSLQSISSDENSVGVEAGLGLSPKKRNVDLSRKMLASFPMEVCEHRQISDLNLGYNKLVSLPPEIGQLTSISVLDVRNNKLTSLPQELEQCTVLTDIIISFNSFKELPPVLYTFKHLENIIANDNHIDSINVAGLKEIPVLACLDLHNNNIGQVPPQLATICTLNHVQLGGNPFRIPRSSILAKGTVAILDYLRDRLPT